MGIGLFGQSQEKHETTTISTVTDARQTASGSGIIQRGGALGEGATSIGGLGGGQGNVAQPGATQVAGHGQLTINTLDAEVAKAALESVGSLSERQSDTFGQMLGQISSLAESKQTEGESDRNRILMWVALAALAVVALIFWRQR